MSLKTRYEIAPQMADYDELGKRQQWVPYLMSFSPPDCAFASVTTDGLGFRTTVDREGKPIGTDILSSPQGATSRCSIVAGGSTAFGVGATQDAHTIPSVLNRTTDGLWLNFGGRTFNSTQELLLFLLHLPRKLDRVVIFSGANNIVLACLRNGSSPVYGAFYNQSLFERAMSNPPEEYIGIRRATRQLFKEAGRHVRMTSTDGERTEVSLEGCYQDILACFQRDLRAFKVLTDGVGARLYFALQPMATWIDKALSPEEQRMFDILDDLHPWRVLAKGIRDVRGRYFEDVARICTEENVPFHNLNLDPAFRDAAWLFVDRVHLTDRGYALAAEIMKKEFGL